MAAEDLDNFGDDAIPRFGVLEVSPSEMTRRCRDGGVSCTKSRAREFVEGIVNERFCNDAARGPRDSTYIDVLVVVVVVVAVAVVEFACERSPSLSHPRR